MSEQDTVEIEIRICPDKHGKISISNAGGQSATSSKDEDGVVEIQIGINPTGKSCHEEFREITVPISDGTLPAYCDEEDYFWWERATDYIDADTEDPVIERLPSLFMVNPECCQWREATVKAYGPDRCGSIYDASRGCTYLSYEAGGDGHGKLGSLYKVQVPQNRITPGMLVKLWHRFSDNVMHEAGASYWCTCCFTGGRVVSINGEYNDSALTYTVSIENENVVCKSYGFEKYEVGDWVIIAKPGGNCENIERAEACKDGCGGADDGSTDHWASYLLTQINDAREFGSLTRLRQNFYLKKAARRHAEDMAANCFLGPTGTDGSTLTDRVTDAGYIEADEESSTYDQVSGVHAEPEYLWTDIKSNGAAYNVIMNPAYRDMGIYAVDAADICSETAGGYGGKTFVCIVVGEKSAAGIEAFPYRIIPMKIAQDGA